MMENNLNLSVIDIKFMIVLFWFNVIKNDLIYL